MSIVLIAADAASIADGLGQSTIESGAVHGPNVDVVVARPETGERTTAAAARAAARTHGELLCFLPATSTALEPGWPRLAAAVEGTRVAAAPLVVHPLRSPHRATPHDGRVRAHGLAVAVAGDAPALRAVGAGTTAVPEPGSTAVAGATAASRSWTGPPTRRRVGLPDADDLDLAMFELCPRAACPRRRGRRRRRRGDRGSSPGDLAAALDTPVSRTSAAWRAYVEGAEPELMRAADPLPAGTLRIALTVAAPSEKVAPRWGDWHLAEAFARALRRRGHVVPRADARPRRRSRRTCVRRSLRGARPRSRAPHTRAGACALGDQPPRAGEREECDAADLVLVASSRFADHLRARTRTPVEVMLQATDVTRFRPVPPVPLHVHDVAVVAKSRDVFPASVAGHDRGRVPAHDLRQRMGTVRRSHARRS